MLTMKLNRPLLAVLVILCLSIVVPPAIAGDVTVDSVVAAQYGFGYFVAVVIAHGTADLVNAQLSVNGTTAIVPDSIQEYVIDPAKNTTVWAIVKHANGVVKPADVLTATVTDIEGDADQKAALCGRGFVRLHQTALCK